MLDELLIFHVDVGFTDTRPITVDQYVSRVVVSAHCESEAHCVAALMVMRPRTPHLGIADVQMPTSTQTVLIEV